MSCEEEEGSWNQALFVPTIYWVSAQYLISELIRGMMDGFVLPCLTQRMLKTRQLVADECCFFHVASSWIPFCIMPFISKSSLGVRAVVTTMTELSNQLSIRQPVLARTWCDGWEVPCPQQREWVPSAALLAVFRMFCSMEFIWFHAASMSQPQGTGVAVPWPSNISAVLNQRFSMVLAFFQFDTDRALCEVARFWRYLSVS